MKLNPHLLFCLRLCADTQPQGRTDLMQKAPITSRRCIYILREGVIGGRNRNYDKFPAVYENTFDYFT